MSVYSSEAIALINYKYRYK